MASWRMADAAGRRPTGGQSSSFLGSNIPAFCRARWETSDRAGITALSLGVFRQPPLQGLDRDRRPDFMWITRATSQITPICIEIEKPGKEWFKSAMKADG